MNTAELEYVGFWPRVGAQIIDTIIVLVITTPLLSWISDRAFNGNLEQLLSADSADLADLSISSLVPGPAELLIGFVLPAIAIIWLWRKREATPGKMAFGARVVDAKTGKAITTLQGFIRWFGYWVAAAPLFLGFIWVGIDPRKQGWHDKLAGTVVVRAKVRGPQSVKFEQT